MSPESRQHSAGIEDQLWPIVCATVVLVGVLSVVVFVNGDFDDERLLFNGYTQLAAVAVFGAAIIFLGSKVKGRARRTAELAILLSLALHAVGGLSAVYLFDSKLAFPGSHNPSSEPALESADESQPPADYHWGRNDEEDEAQQAFEKPVETDLRDQAVAAAAVKPRDIERPVPAAEVPRAAKPDLTPLAPQPRPRRTSRWMSAVPALPRSRTCRPRTPWRWCGKRTARRRFPTPRRRPPSPCPKPPKSLPSRSSRRECRP